MGTSSPCQCFPDERSVKNMADQCLSLKKHAPSAPTTTNPLLNALSMHQMEGCMLTNDRLKTQLPDLYDTHRSWSQLWSKLNGHSWSGVLWYLLIQLENATCSSLRTECVVPSVEACVMPPCVMRFSRFCTIFLNACPTSFSDLTCATNWVEQGTIIRLTSKVTTGKSGSRSKVTSRSPIWIEGQAQVTSVDLRQMQLFLYVADRLSL